MEVRELKFSGAYVFTPPVFPDRRGRFVVPYHEPTFVDTIGHPLHVGQSNHSVSKKGAIRGLHFTDVPPGQAKYIYCAQGAVLDVVVDVRLGSPTYGEFEPVHLDSVNCQAVYVAEGLGHSFVALDDDSVVCYLCSTSYNPSLEHGVTPLDPTLSLPWPPELTPILSDKDNEAPTLAEAERRGLLPRYADCVALATTKRA